MIGKLELARFRGHLTVCEGGVCDAEEPPCTYTAKFRRQIVELFRAGRSPAELAKEFERSLQAIRNWIFRAESDGGLVGWDLRRVTRLMRDAAIRGSPTSARRAPPTSGTCPRGRVSLFAHETRWRAI